MGGKKRLGTIEQCYIVKKIKDNGMKWNEKGRDERLKMQQCNQGSRTFIAFG